MVWNETNKLMILNKRDIALIDNLI